MNQPPRRIKYRYCEKALLRENPGSHLRWLWIFLFQFRLKARKSLLAIPALDQKPATHYATNNAMNERLTMHSIHQLLTSRCLALIVLLGLLSSCSPEARLQSAAEDYVTLALTLNLHQVGEVDSYFGPESLMPSKARPLQELQADASALMTEVAELEVPENSARQQGLVARLKHLINILDLLQNPGSLNFAEEASALYQLPMNELPPKTRMDEQGRVVFIEREPTALEIEQKRITEELDALLPGRGSLPFRIASLQARHMVPLDKREEVFQRALAACRDATKDIWELPADENLSIEWTRDVSSPWHRYLGNNQSSLQINPLTIGFAGSMLDVACHEGYPGHHAQFLLKTASYAGAEIPVEDQLVLLRSPEGILREAAADYGVKLAFTTQERNAFERDVLFPMAGMDTGELETYLQVHLLVKQLAVTTVPILQEFGDQALPRNAAAVALESESLVASPMALLDFIEKFGAYSVGYTLAEQRLSNYIDARASQKSAKWSLLKEVLENSSEIANTVFTAGAE